MKLPDIDTDEESKTALSALPLILKGNSSAANSGYYDYWLPKYPSLLTVIALDTLFTLIVAVVVVSCVMGIVRKRAQLREERDKLGRIIQLHFWENEEKICQLLQIINKMRETIIFREVTELHLLAFKYRHENRIIGQKPMKENLPTSFEGTLPNTQPVFDTLMAIKKVERLFDALAVELPCKGRCPPNITRAFSSHLFNISQGTCAVWSNHKGKLIISLLQYFAGRGAADRFSSYLISDDDLESMIVARVPYAGQLCLKVDHFVLMEVDISSDLKIDIRNKIRYIDTTFSKNSRLLLIKEKQMMEAYYMAREICLKNNFIQNKNYFPDIVSKVGEASKVGDCVIFLRHLLRLMCTAQNIRKLESDDKFFQFLMQLHEALYSWSDTQTMLEVIERSRSNIYSYLRGLTAEQILMDKEFTKAKLEHVEKELYRHLNYLTVKQVHDEREKRNPLRRADTDPKMRSMDSETSVYTMAMSASSFLMKRQASQEKGDLDCLHQQSIDQSSLLSGSSMYATAASLSSVNENIPLMGTPNKGLRLERQQSPLSDVSDYLETAV
ncbi:hypothetical protein CAPTEDRAFT_197781 [Capitella teleta]|uniref:Uncharacterized protein n=1 Tax=Capitella teleta TaxID=283909 RepID=R7TJW2_CAPTE|nr:hypothetical protein CAPTEDRAFT_197781 [Capitella teleta]|eukprot:ELT94009.1 hypothetical protein CAPTEDRAFT_197781 [Capitella teleta]